MFMYANVYNGFKLLCYLEILKYLHNGTAKSLFTPIYYHQQVYTYRLWQTIDQVHVVIFKYILVNDASLNKDLMMLFFLWTVLLYIHV